MSDDDPRTPFSALRSWVPARDETARVRARALLDAEIAHAAEPAPGRQPRRRFSRGRWTLSIGLAVMAAGAGAGVAALLQTTQHTGHLPVFTSSGKLSPQFHVGSRGTGYCFTASLATGASDAYRCIEGNLIHDPCFAPRHPDGTVACFLDPWHPVTLLRLDRPLPHHGPEPAGALPWAIETTDGRRCVFLTGATAPMGGERINYGCINGSFLIGDPSRRTPLWTIRSAPGYRPDVPGHPTPISHFAIVGILLTVP
jgi:hypothetical protein